MRIIKVAFSYLLRAVGAIVVLFFFLCLLTCGVLMVVAFPYHLDAKQLDGFDQKQLAAYRQLWTAKVCVEMRKHPEHWQGTGVNLYPCGDDQEQDEEDVLRYQDDYDSWTRLIAQRKAEWEMRESGRLGFLAAKMRDSDAGPFQAIPDRLWSALKWSSLTLLMMIFAARAFYPTTR